MITKPQFIKFCQLYRAQSEKVNAAYKLNIDLIDFVDDYHAAQNILMEGLFTKVYSDAITDWLCKTWEGEIFEGDKRIVHIKSDEELYDYIIKQLANEK